MNDINSLIENELAQGINLSIINLIDELIKHAFYSHASDIHIDPLEKSIRIRLRIDGILEDFIFFPKEIYSEIISRVKILSNLRTDEHLSAQDGRFRNIISEMENIDIRVSIIPSYYGENIVLRLLSEKNEEFTLETLGFSKENENKIINAINKTKGMILVTGPTGSGKTTTLYTLIKLLNKKEISIVTIEDPIEYAINGIKQIQVNQKTNLSFANGLRSILRQDPNIIMVGEIRDNETASIAINTALTGHLLLSTLHTNDGATTIPRLIDMKIEPYLIASTLNIVIGQRLVRKICKYCIKIKYITADEYNCLLKIIPDKLLNQTKKFFTGTGCNKCNNTGYAGRILINEVLEADKNINKIILEKSEAEKIKQIAIKNGMTTMLCDGFNKAISGITTIKEILRVAYE
jgi:type IV pilus assembly protein PilB